MEEFPQQKGVIIIIAFLTLGILLFLGTYFLSFTIAESKISKSQGISTKNYFLAEAGIHKAIWKLKNDTITSDGDDPWATCFVTSTASCTNCNTWSDSFTIDTNSLVPNSNIVVSIQNLRCAEGQIIATSTVALTGGKTSQRVVKTRAFRALGSLTEDSPLFAGSPSGESIIDSSIMNVYDGNLFVNNNLRIRDGGEVYVYDNSSTTEIKEGKILVVGNCIFTGSKEVSSYATCCSDTCNSSSTCECTDKTIFDEWCETGKCPPKFVEVSAVDFDSYEERAEQAELYGQCSVVGKNSAETVVVTSNKCLFSEKKFKDLLEDVGTGGILILEHKADAFATSTYYVKGEITLERERTLEINGVLVADKTVEIARKSDGYLVINDAGPGIPSGLLTQGKMNFGGKKFKKKGPFEVDVTGLLYATEELRFESIVHTFTVKGGIITRKFYFDSGWSNPLNIYLDNDIIREGIWGGPLAPEEESIEYSPVVTVEHWEESY